MFHTRVFQITLRVFIGCRYDKEGLPGGKVGRGEGVRKFSVDRFYYTGM